MNKSVLEIPYAKDRDVWYRLFEILPAALSLCIAAVPVILSFVNVRLAAFWLIAYVLIIVVRSSAMSFRVVQGYHNIKLARKVNWEDLLDDLEQDRTVQKNANSKNPLLKGHYKNIIRLRAHGPLDLKPSEVIHVVIIATYNESQSIIHPTIESIRSSNGFRRRKTALFIAYEERAGEQKEQETLETIRKYNNAFFHAEAVKHHLKDGEVAGKGANATFTGRRVAEWAHEQGIDPSCVLVTVLDADNRTDKNYFSLLTYVYVSTEDRKKKAYQPTALYNNNVWDVPAIMRLCAIANTYFHTANSMRIHALRNFSAHAQSLDALIEMDFWSVRTIVEDGHQFWRSYVHFDGDYTVLPLYTPVYQDAVLASTYKKTFIAQFKQIRRWTYGASDIAYVGTRVFLRKNSIPKFDAITKFGRLLESHVGWATSAPLLLLAGWIPLLVASQTDNIAVQQLPSIIGTINTMALIFAMATVYIGVVTLPKRPSHHKRRRSLGFVWQWILTPVVGVVFNSFAAINSQLRLAFKRYIETFDVTEKAVLIDRESLAVDDSD